MGESESGQVVVSVDLTDEERKLLAWGLNEWRGPARCTEEMAVAMGFVNHADLMACDPLIDVVRSGKPLSTFDWRRVVLAVEVVFASSVVGSGSEWHITVGIGDEETILLLRSIQEKVTRSLSDQAGTRLLLSLEKPRLMNG